MRGQVALNPGRIGAEDRDVATQVDFGLAASAALDNGMTVAAGLDLDENAGKDDSGFTLSGDFGTIGLVGMLKLHTVACLQM